MSTSRDVLRKIDHNLKKSPPKDITPKEDDPSLWNLASVIYWMDRKDRQGLVSDPLEDFENIHPSTQQEYMRRVEIMVESFMDLVKRY